MRRRCGADVRRLLRCFRTRTQGLLAVLVAAVVLGGCSSGPDQPTTPTPSPVSPDALAGVRVVVGSSRAVEQQLLGALTSELLKAAGATVVDEGDLADSRTARHQLIAGTIDVYWDYTGVAWTTYLGHSAPIAEAVPQYQAVSRLDLTRHHVKWGPMSTVQINPSIATTTDVASTHGIATVSAMIDYLEGHRAASLCVSKDFASSPRGLAAFERTYAPHLPAGSVRGVAANAIYDRINRGGCTFGQVISTDGQIDGLDLQPLVDDRHFFPLGNAAPVVKARFDRRQPQVLSVLTPLADALTTRIMAMLTADVSAKREKPADVASAFLSQAGLVH